MIEQVYKGQGTQSTLIKVHENSKVLKQDLIYMGHQLHLESWKMCVTLFCFW